MRRPIITDIERKLLNRKKVKKIKPKPEVVGLEHEYYDDHYDSETGYCGGHKHCWFVTIIPWEEWSFGKKYHHLATRELTYIKK